MSETETQDLLAEIRALRSRLDAMEKGQREEEHDARFQELCQIARTGTIEEIKASLARWNADKKRGVI